MATLLDSPPVRTADVDYPELVVEWLPCSGPFAADGDWCDITAYVVTGSSFTGRQYELERFQSGTLTLTLRTASRLFDPEFTSGPFFPWLLPLRQVRVSAVWSGVRYDVWRGYVTDWGQTVDAPDNLFETSITAKDALLLFEQMALPASWLELAISKDRPTHWWRLDEASGTVAIDSGYGSTRYDGSYINKPSLSNATVVPFDGGRQGVTFDGSPVQYVSIPPTASEGASTYSLEVWFTRAGEVGDDADALVTLGTVLVAGSYATLIMTSQGRVTWSDGNVTLDTADVATTSGRHQVVVTRSGSTVSLYLDGVLTATGTTAMGGLPTDRWFVGSDNAMQGVYVSSGWNGAVANLAFWSGTALTATQVAAHYTAGMLAHAGDDTGTHIARVLDYKGWPSTLRDIDTGVSTVGAYALPGTVKELVHRMADTEVGQTYIGPDGKLVHRNRHNLWLESRSQTSQATFGDGHGAATLLYQDVSLPRDEVQLRNPVAVARSGGVTVTATDSTLFDKYGERAWSAPITYDSADNVMTDRAAYFLSRYKDLGTRLEQMVLQPRRVSTLWPQVLGRAIGDRITVTRKPLDSGNETITEQIIEAVGHRFSPRAWVTTFRGSPAETDAFFILDDTTYGVLDYDALAY